MRENAGFEILNSTRINPRTEVVIGHRDKYECWVCWYYNIKKDYYSSGKYTDTYPQVKDVYIERIQRG